DHRPMRPVSVGKLVLFGFFAAGFFGVTLELTAIDWAAFRLSDDFALSAGSAAFGYVAVTAGMTVSRFVADSVVARLGTMTTTWISLGLTATGMLIANLSASSSLSLVGFALNGAGIAALLPAMYDTAAKLPGRSALGLGALTAGLRTAALSVPGVVGLLAGSGLSVGQAVVVVALPSVVGFGVAVSRMGVFR
ncbi:MAG: hypothetical protein KDB16_05465, partial [Acidimicrobiales bacterium]|nr:hypothetical protein [Acidimicrobiales bacterium]